MQQLKKRSQRGFTLVEMLVALLVLSVGLLGIAGMQLASLRNTQGAYVRSQASILAYDITERMRANREAARAGEYDIDLEDDPATGSSQSAVDILAWRDRIKAALPAGVGAVAIDGGLITVTIEWEDGRDDAPVLTFEYQTRL